MDDGLISQLQDTPADADYGESDLIKMRKVLLPVRCAALVMMHQQLTPLSITLYEIHLSR